MVERIEALRRQRLTGKAIAAEVGVSPATVSRILKRLGLNKLSALEPAEPVRRYERERPGELIHIDIKKLGKFNQIGHRITGDRTGQSNSRGVGWEFVHVCIDDASRIAFSQIMKTERKAMRRRLPQGRRRLLRKPRHQRRARHDRQRLLLQILRLPQGLQAARPQAHPHQTLHAQDQRQGRALHPDRLREWAYARAYELTQRADELPFLMHRYNWHRPHGSIGAKPPISTLGLTGNNLLRLHS